MPIKFRCPNCRQFLGISRSKAGEISDCPMCGKTLRVPDLDGTVRSLPTPELNLEDSSLVDALGELAGIGTDEDSGGPLPTSAADVHVAVEQTAPTPMPVALEPLAPATEAPVAGKPTVAGHLPRPHDTETSVSQADGTIDDPNATLQSIRSTRSAVKRASRKRPALQRTVVNQLTPTRVAIAAVFVAMGYGLALVMSPSGTPVPVSPSSGPADAVAEVIEPQVGSSDQGTAPAVTGRITYVTESGDSRPDEGAKILALPQDRRGTVKLDVVGFLVGAAEVDEEIASGTLRALGGAVGIADARGEYAISFDRSGGYHLLVISRHQSRSWESGVEDKVQKILARFFIRPSTLLGQLAYDLQELHYRGQGTSVRDIGFARE